MPDMNRLEMNLMQEAKLYIFNAIPLPDRTNQDAINRREMYVNDFKKQWEDQFKRKWTFGDTKQRELKQWTPDQAEMIRARVQPQVDALAQQFDLSPEDKENWADWAQSLYEIDNGRVTSYAKEDVRGSQPKTWQFESDDQAAAKVAELILWKINDRKRNRGDINKDLGGPAPLQ